MQKIIYDFRPAPSIEVNGHVFTLRMSDADIFDQALKISARYAKLSAKTPPAQVLKAVRECAAAVDEMLGEGAMAKISAGRPVRMADALNVMTLIAEAAARSYTEKLESYE